MALMVLDDKNLGLKFQDDEDLERLILHGKINTSQIQEYQNLPDIPKIFKDLVNVGTMLGLAKTYAGHNQCATTILRVTCNYKELISDSFVTSTAFVSTCLQACKNVQLAYKLCKKQKFDLMTKQIMACATAAGKMAEDVAPLIEKAKQLTTDTYHALEQTQNDQNTTEQDKKKMHEFIQNIKADEAKARTQVHENEKIKEAYQKQLRQNQDKLDTQEKQVIAAAEEMQKLIAQHADEFMAKESTEKYAKDLADAEEADRQEWLDEKKEIENKRQARWDAEVKAQKQKEMELKEEKEKKQKRWEEFDKAQQEARKAHEKKKEEAEAQYEAEMKAWKRSQTENKLRNSKAKTATNAANEEITRLKEKQTDLNEKLKTAEKDCRAAHKEWQQKKNNADKAKNDIGFFGSGTADANTKQKWTETSEAILKERREEERKLKEELSSVNIELSAAQNSLKEANEAEVVVDPEDNKPKRKNIRAFKPTEYKEEPQEPTDSQQPTNLGANMKNFMSTVGSLFEKDEFAIPPEPAPGRRVLRLQKEQDAKIEQFNRVLEAKKKSHEAAIAAKEALLAKSREDMGKEKEAFSHVEHGLAEEKSKLAKTLQTLEHSVSNEDDLQKALEGLGLAMQTLGKIAVTFDNVKKFWSLTKQHCERIALDCKSDEMEAYVALEEEGELMVKIDTLLKNWAVLGRQNVAARNAIAEASDNVDEFFMNIPVEGERKDFIAEKVKILQASMTDALEEEEERVKEIMEDFDEK